MRKKRPSFSSFGDFFVKWLKFLRFKSFGLFIQYGGTSVPSVAVSQGNAPSSHTKIQNPNPNLIRFHPLPPPAAHRIQFPLVLSTPPIPLA